MPSTVEDKIFIGQPGAFGDILVCAPIAKHYYDEGYQVYWPVGVEHLSLVEKFPYVIPVILPSIPLLNIPDLDENLFSSRILMGKNIANSMGAEYLPVGDRPNTPVLDGETVEEKKYRVGNVPFGKKYTLSWERDNQKEDELFSLVVTSDEYIFCHLNQSDGTRGNLMEKETREIVECLRVDGYDILDWYKVIMRASAIYCIESSLQCFIDGLGDSINPDKKFLLSTKSSRTTTTSKGWNKRLV